MTEDEPGPEGLEVARVRAVLESRMLGIASSPRLGRFAVLGRSGEGAMGVVYSCYDDALERPVAVKVLRDDADSPSLRDRLLREARAMARLSHPNVAQVYEVGEHLGRTFVAMELVRGRTLRAWQRADAPPVRALVLAYRQAAAGLAAAHRAEIVHRDFKPDNAMIDDGGRVRVLDFGLARAPESAHVGDPTLDGEPPLPIADDAATPLTRTGALVGTPTYMSIEVLRGTQADARSDQFSFCVSLWEALHGTRPFAGTDVRALIAAIERGQPQLGRAGVPAWLSRLLRRGLHTDPTARHPSMDALVHALDRGLGLRRRAAAAAAIGVAATIGLGVWGVGVLERERRRNACEADAQAVAEVWSAEARDHLQHAVVGTGVAFAESSFERALPMLDAYASGWRDTYARACIANEDAREQGREHEQWPAGRACLEQRRGRLASLLTALGEAPDATTIRRLVPAVAALAPVSACEDPMVLMRNPAQPDDADTGDLQRRLWLAGGRLAAGNYPAGLALAREVADEAQTRGHAALHRGALLLGAKLSERAGAYDDATALFGEAFDLANAAGAQDDELAAATGLTLVVGGFSARYEEGLWWGRIATGLAERIGVSEQLEGAMLDAGLALIHDARGDYDDARQHYAHALVVRERVQGSDHPDVAAAMAALAMSHRALGDLDESARLHRAGLAIAERTLGPDHPQVANALLALANTLAESGDPTAARSCYERAIAIDEAALGPDHPELAAALGGLALVLEGAGELDRAEQLHVRALAIERSVFGGDHPRIATSLVDLAHVYIARGETERARVQLEEALAMQERVLGPDHPHVAVTAYDLASVYLEQGAHERALAATERAIATWERAHGKSHPHLGSMLVGRANVLLALARLDEADRDYQRSLAILEATLGPGHPQLAFALVGLASVAVAQRRWEDAGKHAERALALRIEHGIDGPLRVEAEALVTASKSRTPPDAAR